MFQRYCSKAEASSHLLMDEFAIFYCENSAGKKMCNLLSIGLNGRYNN
jgi:hypothetical protein